MPVDKSTLDTLVATFEAGAADLDAKAQVNADAQAKATATAADLAAAQAVNKSNVVALKTFIAAMADDGTSPVLVVVPAPIESAPVLEPVATPAP